MWMILAYHDHRWIQTLTLWPATVGPTGLSILHEKNDDMLYRLYILPLVVWQLAICARSVLIAMLSMFWNKPMETSRDACRFNFCILVPPKYTRSLAFSRFNVTEYLLRAFCIWAIFVTCWELSFWDEELTGSQPLWGANCSIFTWILEDFQWLNMFGFVMGDLCLDMVPDFPGNVPNTSSKIQKAWMCWYILPMLVFVLGKKL